MSGMREKEYPQFDMPEAVIVKITGHFKNSSYFEFEKVNFNHR